MNVKSVLITGASRGIGLEFVKQYLNLPQPPECVLATCRDPSSAEDLTSLAENHNNLSIIKLDLTTDSDFESAVNVSVTCLSIV